MSTVKVRKETTESFEIHKDDNGNKICGDCGDFVGLEAYYRTRYKKPTLVVCLECK